MPAKLFGCKYKIQTNNYFGVLKKKSDYADIQEFEVMRKRSVKLLLVIKGLRTASSGKEILFTYCELHSRTKYFEQTKFCVLFGCYC